MNVLITGSAGMLGTSLKVAVDSKVDSNNNFIFTTKKNLNLLDLQKVKNFLISNEVDCIIHLASEVSGIGGNKEKSFLTFLNNNLINNNICEAALSVGIKKFINISSSSIYSPSENPLKESSIMKGDPDHGNIYYSLSKLMFTRFLAELNKDPSRQFISLIPPNLFGPNDRNDEKTSHLINAIFNKTIKAKKNDEKSIEIWGDGFSRREFLYVQNLSEYICNYVVDNINLMPSLLNVGCYEDFSILEYYEFIAEIIGIEPKYIFNKDKPSGAKRKLLNSKEALAYNWNPSISTKEGIKELYKYEKNRY